MCKNYLIQLLLFAAFTLSTPLLYSQRYSEKGDRYFENNLFQDAIKYYELEMSKGGGKYSEYAKKQLAECYRLTGDFAKAEDAYRKILKSKKNKTDEKNYLNYGNALKSSAKFEEAKEQFLEYIKLMPDDPIGPLYLASCDSAQKWLDETMGRTAKNMDIINSELSDFSPVFIHDDLFVFSSSRKGSKEAIISFNGGMEINHLDFYQVSLPDLKVGSPNFILPLIGLNSAQHEGPATFSSDGSEVYFTKTIKGEKNIHTGKIVNRLQVLYSKKDSTGKWSTPISAFHFNSSKYSVGHPSLSKDGKTIFFMSDMRNGEGKTDIYYSIKLETGEWSDPINAGKEINTFGFELFPYLSANGTLYFSSNGHPGMGQLDIFSAVYVKGRWTKVTNLKPPINSIGDDFGIALDSSGEHGFFSSDRFGGMGAEDIYAFSFELPVQLQLSPSKISISDFSMYDGFRYKIGTENSESSRDLIPRNGKYNISIERDTTYEITVRKAIMVYNKITIQMTEDTLKNQIAFTISPHEKDVRISLESFKETPYEGLPIHLINQENKTVVQLQKSENNPIHLNNGIAYILIIGSINSNELKEYLK
jgi:tetratricopeptide (TPR) repeat protein